MLFSKKGRRKPGQIRHDEKSLYPVIHITESLKDYRESLVKKEVDSLSELGFVVNSFADVLSEAEHFQSQLENFDQSFVNIEGAADRFVQVRSGIAQTVSDAQDRVEELKKTSIDVQASYSEMEHTFEQLQSAVRAIQRCMSKIVLIADETNILAINASIVAARAGEQGKGFSVVAAKVRELAEEIKGLTEEADAGIANVEIGAGQLSSSIQASQQALGQGVDIVNSTYDSFSQITSAAEVAISVQSEISGVISNSRKELRGICQFFDRMKSQYQKIMSHLSRASKLGTTKSAMFEDIDNMLGQIPQIIQDPDAGRK